MTDTNQRSAHDWEKRINADALAEAINELLPRDIAFVGIGLRQVETYTGAFLAAAHADTIFGPEGYDIFSDISGDAQSYAELIREDYTLGYESERPDDGESA